MLRTMYASSLRVVGWIALMAISGACTGSPSMPSASPSGSIAIRAAATPAGVSSPPATARALRTNTPAASTLEPPAARSSLNAVTERPYDVFVPDTYDGAQPLPLLLLLHGYGSSGAEMEAVFKLEPLAQTEQFLYVHPDGTNDSQGERSWNATEACCHPSPPVDDSAYLASVIDEVAASYNVDSARIYLFGISNGGFMAYRMACDHADRIAAIVSVVGAMVLDSAKCRPTEPVSVLEIHGTADTMVPYDGGVLIPGHPFPGTEQTVADWAEFNGCRALRAATGERLNLESRLNGKESVVSRFEGCRAGTAVDLWTVEGGSHMLQITANFVPDALHFLLAHPKKT